LFNFVLCKQPKCSFQKKKKERKRKKKREREIKGEREGLSILFNKWSCCITAKGIIYKPAEYIGIV